MTTNGSAFTCYDLITDDLVKQAVKNDKGSEAEVISWEIHDFTNKGDNYTSNVTSIEVKFKINDKPSETSYVVKLNPLRPVNTFTEVLEIMYSHEGIVLREIADGLNKQLKNLNLAPIKFPTLYSRNLEKGKQALINENLRKQGFMMHDRTKVMNIEHALLVVEELGRLHASSLLYEETLSPKTIPESFDYFGEPWTDLSNPSFKVFNTMMAGQCRSACSFLEKVPEYEICTKWLTNKLNDMGKYFIEEVLPTKPFEILSHGDCWTNNMLFKYDENGNPIDVRLIDLQSSKKSSPACDINYFYYTSLNGDVRQKHTESLEKTYYKSFSKVLKLAGKEPPFTFSEFEEEMIRRKRFGLVAGLLVLPIIFAEGDEIWDIETVHHDNVDEFISVQNLKYARLVQRKSFKDRFLSMFDEMKEYKVFDD